MNVDAALRFRRLSRDSGLRLCGLPLALRLSEELGRTMLNLSFGGLFPILDEDLSTIEAWSLCLEQLLPELLLP